MISMMNVAILGVIFGFSSSFMMAIVVRLLIGLGNEIMVVNDVTSNLIIFRLPQVMDSWVSQRLALLK